MTTTIDTHIPTHSVFNTHFNFASLSTKRPIPTRSVSTTITDSKSLASQFSLFATNIKRSASISTTKSSRLNKTNNTSDNKQQHMKDSKKKSISNMTSSTLSSVVPSFSKRLSSTNNKNNTSNKKKVSSSLSPPPSSLSPQQQKKSNRNNQSSTIEATSTSIEKQQQKLPLQRRNSIATNMSPMTNITRTQRLRAQSNNVLKQSIIKNNNNKKQQSNENGLSISPPSSSTSSSIANNSNLSKYIRNKNEIISNSTNRRNSIHDISDIKKINQPLLPSSSKISKVSVQSNNNNNNNNNSNNSLINAQEPNSQLKRQSSINNNNIYRRTRTSSVSIVTSSSPPKTVTPPVNNNFIIPSTSSLSRRHSMADFHQHQHQHHHHHHHKQNQKVDDASSSTFIDPSTSTSTSSLSRRHSQSHLRHPSWLDSAGFMRQKKCSFCHPEPPTPTTVITPPVATGVPTFRLPAPPVIRRSSSKINYLNESGFSINSLSSSSSSINNDSSFSIGSNHSHIDDNNNNRKRRISMSSFYHQDNNYITSSSNTRPSSNLYHHSQNPLRRNSRIPKKNGLEKKLNNNNNLISTITTEEDDNDDEKKKKSTSPLPAFLRRFSKPSTTSIATTTTTSAASFSTDDQMNQESFVMGSKLFLSDIEDGYSSFITTSSFTLNDSDDDDTDNDNDDENTSSTYSIKNDSQFSSTSSSSSKSSSLKSVSMAAATAVVVSYASKYATTPANKQLLLHRLTQPDFLKRLGDELLGVDSQLDEWIAKNQHISLPTVIDNKDDLQRWFDKFQHKQQDQKIKEEKGKKRESALDHLQGLLNSSSSSSILNHDSSSEQQQQQQKQQQLPSPSSISSTSSIPFSYDNKMIYPSSTSISSMDTQLNHQLIHPTLMIKPSSSTSTSSSQQQSIYLELDWSQKLQKILQQWFMNQQHGTLGQCKVDLDGSLIMTFSGNVRTLEMAFISHLINSELDITTTPTQLFQHQYSLSLNKNERIQSFHLLLPGQWVPDDQVHQCQFKTKTNECTRHFDWINRKHHCRRCGGIFCQVHSSNKLPLFKENDDDAKWSRVCDTCCYDLVGNHIVNP